MHCNRVTGLIAGMIKTQSVAISVIARVMAGESLTKVLQETWRSDTALTPQQRGAVQDISYGVFRFYGQLDALLRLLSDRPVKDRDLRYLLLVALYQLQYSKASSYAIVDNAVSVLCRLQKGRNRGAKGLVNAVLRHFLRQREALLLQAMADETGQYSYPQWWIQKLRTQYPQDYRQILDAGNQHPPMILRVNPRKTTVSDYQELLHGHAMEAEIMQENAIRLVRPVAVDRLPGFSEGQVSVQDAGAQLAAPLLDARKGMRVLDACAAPGGKSAHLLELADIDLTVLDNDAGRLARISENLERSGLTVSRMVCGDAAQPAAWWDNKPFDRILADVPCSASGVVRRHPDIKWLRREEDIARFATTQKTILDALWRVLAQGGKLLYVTCSVFMEENGWQMEEFLHGHPDATVLPLPGVSTINGQLLPDSLHDGFFYTLLHKA